MGNPRLIRKSYVAAAQVFFQGTRRVGPMGLLIPPNVYLMLPPMAQHDEGQWFPLLRVAGPREVL